MEDQTEWRTVQRARVRMRQTQIRAARQQEMRRQRELTLEASRQQANMNQRACAPTASHDDETETRQPSADVVESGTPSSRGLTPEASRTRLMNQRRLRVELRRLRVKLGVAHSEVASALDWAASKIIQIENGEWAPAKVVRRLVRFLLPLWRRWARRRNIHAACQSSRWANSRRSKPPGRMVMASSRSPRGPNRPRMTDVMRGVWFVRD